MADVEYTVTASWSQTSSILIPRLLSTLKAKVTSLLSSNMENTLSSESITLAFHTYIPRCVHKPSFNTMKRISLFCHKNRNNQRASNSTSRSSLALLISIFKAALQLMSKTPTTKKVGSAQQAKPRLWANLGRQSGSQRSRSVEVGKMLCKQRRMLLEMRSQVKLRSLISDKHRKLQILRLPYHP